MSNTTTKFKSIIQNKWWKKMMLFETVLFFIIIIITHYHGACSTYGWVGQMPEANYGCIKHIAFFKYFGINYFYFAITLILILSIFLILTGIMGKWTEKILSKDMSYLKIFVIELWSLLMILFGITMLFILSYDGNSCLGDNCVGVSLFTLIRWWLPDIIFPLFFNLIFLGIIIVPYLALLIYKNIKKYKP